MMISPEGYYELSLKGKNADEILSEIKKLKRHIAKLKRIVENPEYKSLMCPNESVQISCSREYLERAKETLVELGIEYQPTKAELKANEFNKNIPYITNVILSIGGYFYGEDKYVVVIADDNVHYSFAHSDIPMSADDFKILDLEMTKEEFLEELKEIHIGEWRKHYDTLRFGYDVCDGTQWTLEIRYSNDIKPIEIFGSNAYPYNFDRLKDLMMCEFEN
jgi:hypothetical protein